jgi:hypothetical protein
MRVSSDTYCTRSVWVVAAETPALSKTVNRIVYVPVAAYPGPGSFDVVGIVVETTGDPSPKSHSYRTMVLPVAAVDALPSKLTAVLIEVGDGVTVKRATGSAPGLTVTV